MVNFFARLGWSHGDQEIFSRQELIDLFDLNSVGNSAAIFDDEKLRWLNQQHLKVADPHRLSDLVCPFVLDQGTVTEEMWKGAGEERLTRAASLLRHRAHTLVDLAKMMLILFPVAIEVEEKVTVDERQKELITAICDAFEGCGSFSHDAVEAALREALTAQEAKLKDVAKAIRMSTTGRPVGPGLFDLLSVIGSDLVVSRLRALVKIGGT